jgi:hypothetical protein
MKLKPGASIYGRDPVMRFADAAVEEAFALVNVEPVITSGTDGEHGLSSFHYSGLATDYRSKHLTRHQKEIVMGRLIHRLGVRWDVILEDPDGPNEHFHIERDDGFTRPLMKLGRVHFMPHTEEEKK